MSTTVAGLRVLLEVELTLDVAARSTRAGAGLVVAGGDLLLESALLIVAREWLEYPESLAKSGPGTSTGLSLPRSDGLDRFAETLAFLRLVFAFSLVSEW